MLLNYKDQLKRYVSELTTELNMRKRVWKRIPSQEHRFVDTTHQRRYDVMRLIKKVMVEMTPGELEAIVKRIQNKGIQGKQQKLFK